jgi:hypothetical protein
MAVDIITFWYVMRRMVSSRRVIWVGHVPHMRMRNAFRDMDRNTEKQIVWETCVQMDTIKTDFKEIIWEGWLTIQSPDGHM